MRNRLRIAALATLALAVAAGILIPGVREKQSDQGPELFVLPTERAMSFKDYLGRLATLQAPSRNARPDGYLYMAGLPRIPIYRFRTR